MSTERKGILQRAKSLRTDQQNSHHSNANITTGLSGSERTARTNSWPSDPSEVSPEALGPPAETAALPTAAGAVASSSKRQLGVDSEISISPAFISAETPSKSGVLR